MDEIKYTIVYRKIRYPRLEYKTGSLQLILPESCTNPEEIVRKHLNWIKEKQETILKALEEAETETLVERTDEEFKEMVQKLVKRFQNEFGSKVEKIFYRKMRTKWASCSRRGNITVNVQAKHLPQDLIEYIVCHEVAHTIERKHNMRFWNIVKEKFPDYEKKERALLTYWFAIQKSLDNGADKK
jgi:predicted metal-dependent hydrolase